MSGVITAAGIGAGASLYGANKSSKAAGRAADQQQQMAQKDLAFRRQLYDRYLGLYGPTEEALARQAQSTQPLDYEKNYAAIKQNYGDAMRNISAAMSSRGIAGSGLDIGAARSAALGQAGALSGAYAQGLINRRNLGMELTGRGQIGQAGQAYMGGMQNMANLYGQQAGLYNQAAAQGWQSFGQNLGNLGYSLQGLNHPAMAPMAYGQVGAAYQNANTPLPAGNTYTLPMSDVVPTPPRV